MDAFEIEGQGVVVVGKLPAEFVLSTEFKLRSGDTVTITWADDTTQDVIVRGVDVFQPPLAAPYAEEASYRTVAILLDGPLSRSGQSAKCRIEFKFQFGGFGDCRVYDNE